MDRLDLTETASETETNAAVHAHIHNTHSLRGRLAAWMGGPDSSSTPIPNSKSAAAASSLPGQVSFLALNSPNEAVESIFLASARAASMAVAAAAVDCHLQHVVTAGGRHGHMDGGMSGRARIAYSVSE